MMKLVVHHEPLKRGDYRHSSPDNGYDHSDRSADEHDLDDSSCYDESLAILEAMNHADTLSFEVSSNHSQSSSDKLPSTPLVTCCSHFWQLFHVIALSLCLFWILFMCTLSLQPSMRSVRSIVSHIDPISGLNHPIVHRATANSLSSRWCVGYDISHFVGQINVYLCFHFARWLMCALMFRDRGVLWLNSVAWECVQFSAASVPWLDLRWAGECWFDALLFDVLLTNMLGIELGLFVMRKTGVLSLYHFFDFECAQSSNKLDALRLCVVLWCAVVLFLLQELLLLVVFDVALWYRTDGWLIFLRSFIYALCNLYAMNQLNAWCARRRANRKGNGDTLRSLSWVIVLNLLVLSELLLAVKTYAT